jgi:2,3-dimethylmalate lyase
MIESKGQAFRRLLADEPYVFTGGVYSPLDAQIAEKVGIKAIYLSGYSVAMANGWPDMGFLTQTEVARIASMVAGAVDVPVIADADDGYGNPLNVMRTVREYAAAGVAALHIEDQVAPKRCGHMAGKDVISADQMAAKIRAAVAARRSPDLFVIARTDARAVHGLDEALRRGEQYLKAGADGLFIEAPQSVQELERIGGAFKGVPQLANMLEGGGQTPVLPPAQLAALGFAMAAYPTTLIFRIARTIEHALADIKAGKAIVGNDGVNFAEFKDITRYDQWARIEDSYRRTGPGAA